MKRMAMAAGAAVLIGASAYVAFASTPEAWAELQARAEAACMAASGLDEPRVATPSTNFKHHVFVVVDGIFTKPPMDGQEMRWACLYDKEHQAAEAREEGAFP